VAGMASAAACVYAGLPFDVIKSRIQVGGTGLVQTVSTIMRGRGLVGFYAGALPALASQMAENAALFTANGIAVRNVCRFKRVPEDKLVEHVGLHYACGGFAGFFSGTTICCLETIKVRLQVQQLKLQSGQAMDIVYNGPLDCFFKTWRHEGLQGLFRGLTAMWIRDVPFNAFFLGGYEMAANVIAKVSRKRTKDDLNPAQLMAAGAFGGASAWALVFPVDVIKTRMQSAAGIRQSFLTTARRGYAEHGVRGFYRGVSACVVRAMPANAAMFVVYEYAIRWLRWQDEQMNGFFQLNPLT